MSLSTYHQKYSERSDEELRRRCEMKEKQVRTIFKSVSFTPTSNPIRVAVLGCADARYVPAHKKIFEMMVGRPVELTTFDITTEHLQTETNVAQHDITTPLPNPPYDIAFGHVVLKFIETEKQWDVIRNAYDALHEHGVAIHVFDDEDVTTTDVLQRDGHFSVPLERWKQQLTDRGIRFQDVHWDFDAEEPSLLIRGSKGGALVVFKE